VAIPSSNKQASCIAYVRMTHLNFQLTYTKILIFLVSGFNEDTNCVLNIYFISVSDHVNFNLAPLSTVAAANVSVGAATVDVIGTTSFADLTLDGARVLVLTSLPAAIR